MATVLNQPAPSSLCHAHLQLHRAAALHLQLLQRGVVQRVCVRQLARRAVGLLLQGGDAAPLRRQRRLRLLEATAQLLQLLRGLRRLCLQPGRSNQKSEQRRQVGE